MLLSTISGSLKKLRRTPWRFQENFITPPAKAALFATTFVSAIGQIEKGVITIDEIVFDPENLNALLATKSLDPRLGKGSVVEATVQSEAEALLQAAMSDWVDFWFVPKPKPFVCYTDHDELTTVFANTKSNLNGITEALAGKGFQRIDYDRVF